MKAGEFSHGGWLRPACGKVCKLVCEPKKISAFGYGYECDTICIPKPGRRGCKHCDTTCCLGDDLEGCPPKIEFCWYDWFACGCAQPRTVKLLTKYQAEREIAWYHWEVVDAACCDCSAANGQPAPGREFYKPAPPDAELGDIFAVSDEEWSELEPLVAADSSKLTPTVEAPSSDPHDKSIQSESAFISAVRKLSESIRR
jgi:hypothetical protein